jgi:hypothetical protein
MTIKKSWLLGSILLFVVMVILYFIVMLERETMQIKFLTKSTRTLTAERIENGRGKIKVNGIGSEGVWKEAKETEITLTSKEGAEPRSVNVKAVCDDNMIYILSKYKDSTPLKVGEAWEYDGTEWKKGPHDDTLAFIFNIDNSMPGFNNRGMSVMDSPMTKGKDVFDFTYTEMTRDQADKEKLDFWGWCGLPEFYGRGDDMIMKVDPISDIDRLKPPILTVQHDEHPNVKPWIRNVAIIDGKEVPRYKYRDGKNIDNTPRPYMDDVVEITDYSEFKPGDGAPYVIGIRNAVWGGSKDDILAKGTHPGDNWSVEIARMLDTGYEDDITLKQDNSYTFVILIRDDAKGYSISVPITLKL